MCIGSAVSVARSRLTRALRPTPSVAPKLIKRGILNDSSLVAIRLANGDRHCFFQEDTGFIRQGIYSASTKAWEAHLGYTVATDAKKHSPMTLGYSSTAEVSFAFDHDFFHQAKTC